MNPMYIGFLCLCLVFIAVGFGLVWWGNRK